MEDGKICPQNAKQMGLIFYKYNFSKRYCCHNDARQYHSLQKKIKQFEWHGKWTNRKYISIWEKLV